MPDADPVFKALADPTRRHLLDRLYERDGRTLSELESDLEMTRFGVMKHLRVLEEAGLVVTRRAGREKHHFLNPVPIRLIHDRWIDKYTERHVSALSELKQRLVSVADGGSTRIVIDLSETTIIDSTALGVLIGAVKRLRALDGELAIVNSDEMMAKTFEITGLEEVLTIEPLDESER